MDKCGCGRDGKYLQITDEENIYSCNKYGRCLTYDEQEAQLKKIGYEMLKYKEALEKIVRVNAMDYEYKAWAKEAINNQ